MVIKPETPAISQAGLCNCHRAHCIFHIVKRLSLFSDRHQVNAIGCVDIVCHNSFVIPSLQVWSMMMPMDYPPMSQNDTFIESNKPLEHQSQYQSTLHRITQPITARYSVALMCGLHVHKQSNYCSQQFSSKSIKRICIFTFSQIAKWSTFSFRLFPFYHPKRGAGRYYLAKYISQDSWINMKFFTSLASPNLHENNLSLQFHCRFLPVKYHLMDAAMFKSMLCNGVSGFGELNELFSKQWL